MNSLRLWCRQYRHAAVAESTIRFTTFLVFFYSFGGLIFISSEVIKGDTRKPPASPAATRDTVKSVILKEGLIKGVEYAGRVMSSGLGGEQINYSDIVEKDFSSSQLLFLDLDAWGKFQEKLADHLGVSIGIYDEKGVALAPPSGEGSLCEILKQTEKGDRLYKEAYAWVIEKAKERDEPCVHKCFTGQYLFAIPLYLDTDCFVAILGGHVYLSEVQARETARLAEEFREEASVLQEMEDDTRIVSPQEFYDKLDLVNGTAAPFLKNLYLKGLYEREHSQIKTMIQAAAPVGFPREKDEIYRNAFNTLGIFFDISSASIMEEGPDGVYRAAATFGHNDEAVAGWEIPGDSEKIEKVIASRNPVEWNDPIELKRLGLGEGITSVYIFPMVIEEDVLGLLCIFNTRIPEESVGLINFMIGQLSMMIKNIRWEEAIQKRLKRIEILKDIHDSIVPVLNQEKLFEIIMDKSAELVDAEKGSLMMFDKGENTLSVRAAKGVDKEILRNIKVKIGEGISGLVAQKGEPIIVKDIEKEITARKNRSRYKTRSFVSVPLKVDDRIIGVINISDKITGEIFSEDDLQLLLSFAGYATIALDRRQYLEKTMELEKISVTDPLTGLMNRRYFNDRLVENVERARRYNEPFTLFMIDIDNFKEFNDTYGHMAGDEALKMVAHAVKDAVRSIDIVARFGGEELTVILPNTKKEDSLGIADRMRKDVEIVRLMGWHIPPDAKLSISIGIAEYPADASTAEELMNCADTAMYAAKKAGKNRVVAYGEVEV